MRKPDGYWTFERCRDEALKYSTKTDFRNASQAYMKAHRKGWISEICRHMTPLGSYSFRFVYEIADHENKICYIGLTLNPKRRFQGHFLQGTAKGLVEAGAKLKVVTSLLTKENAIQAERSLIEHYKLLDYEVLNKNKAGGLGGKLIWTFERCRDEAVKYSERTEFCKGSSGAYSSAHLNGWLDAICGHMKRRKKFVYWTFERCRDEALKYRTRMDLHNNANGVYQAAWKNKWLDDICRHMGQPK